ncbi:hypothetical protein BH18VER1_BH18VER1_11220 [soil metagenome]
MIGVTFALPAESSDFLRRLSERKRESANVVLGTLNGCNVGVLHTGVGKQTTAPRFAAFLQQHPPRVLISTGFAGGLTEEPRPGDLLLSENFSDPELRDIARSVLQSFPIHSGRLDTVDRVIHSSGDRASHSAASGAIGADMETAHIAEACTAISLPMLSLRVISDTPHAPFPAAPELLFNIAAQRTNRRRLLLYLGRHPGEIGRFLAFGRQVANARRVLTDALCSVIADDTFARSPS